MERKIAIQVYLGGRWLSREAILTEAVAERIEKANGASILISDDDSGEVFVRHQQQEAIGVSAKPQKSLHHLGVERVPECD